MTDFKGSIHTYRIWEKEVLIEMKYMKKWLIIFLGTNKRKSIIPESVPIIQNLQADKLWFKDIWIKSDYYTGESGDWLIYDTTQMKVMAPPMTVP